MTCLDVFQIFSLIMSQPIPNHQSARHYHLKTTKPRSYQGQESLLLPPRKHRDSCGLLAADGCGIVRIHPALRLTLDL